MEDSVEQLQQVLGEWLKSHNEERPMCPGDKGSRLFLEADRFAKDLVEELRVRANLSFN